ncbi:MAG TPA: hypothetical protein VGJ25_16305 [Gaiellaceae bacterium]|jgi:hypothetical protein
MAKRLKSAAEIAAKWKRVTSGRQADFEAGVKDPAVDWAGPTAAAREAYSQGVQDAIGRGAFEKGVQSASTAAWQRGVTTRGIPRFTQGVSVAEEDMANGIAKPRDVIERTLPTLPPRGPRGAPINQERANRMAQALAEARKRG